jgi:hypothetical protein
MSSHKQDTDTVLRCLDISSRKQTLQYTVYKGKVLLNKRASVGFQSHNKNWQKIYDKDG